MRGLMANEYLWVRVAFVLAIVLACLVLHAVTTMVKSWVVSNSVLDDAYTAIAQRDKAAAIALFPPDQMRTNFNSGAVTLLDRSGHIVAGGSVSASGDRYMPVSQGLTAALAKAATTVRPGWGWRCWPSTSSPSASRGGGETGRSCARFGRPPAATMATSRLNRGNWQCWRRLAC